MTNKSATRNVMIFLLVLFSQDVVQAKHPSFLQLKTDQNTFRGRLAAKNKQSAWIVDRAGQFNLVPFSSVTSFKKFASPFKPQSTYEVRKILQKELGKKYNIAIAGQYIIAASPEKSKMYAEIFDDFYRSFQRYFSTRGFKIGRPEFPLVAIVYQSRNEFIKCCQNDKFRVSPNLAGYYHPLTNRVALFEQKNISVASQSIQLFSNVKLPVYQSRTMSEKLKNTIIHEATHQVAYNTGLHRRMGNNPRWVVEGLATMLEPEGARNNHRRGSIMMRINKDRFVRFGNILKERRENYSLKTFIQSDKMYQTHALDFYAHAWALTFFLSETRPRQYTSYLKIIAERPMFQQYTSQQRLEDFQTAFGDQIDWLEIQFLRYMMRLK